MLRSTNHNAVVFFYFENALAIETEPQFAAPAPILRPYRQNVP